jgi:hypothetical protein
MLPPAPGNDVDPPAGAAAIVHGRRLMRTLWTVMAVLLCLGAIREAIVQITGGGTELTRLAFLDLDGEVSFPTWFSSFVMLLCAALLWLISQSPGPSQDPRDRHRWRLLSGIFVYLSVDETVSVHEAIGNIMAGLSGSSSFGDARWILVFVPLAIALCAYLVPFLRRLPRRSALQMMVAGAVFVAGAAGIEALNAAFRTSDTSVAQAVFVVLEEAGEFTGLLLFAAALLNHLSDNCQQVVVQVKARE